MTIPLLEQFNQDNDKEHSFSVFSAGYEDSEWRSRALIKDTFRRHLASFSLSFSEWKNIDGDSAAKALSKAAASVYSTDKYQNRGEFGELFLHGILRDFYNAQPAISKIYFLDSANDNAKGFDSVHIVETSDGEIDLWLGEAKLYKSPQEALRDITSSLMAHSTRDFFRSEFMAITHKLDPEWPYKDKLKSLIDDNKSLDDIVTRIVFPVFLAFESPIIKKYTRVSEEYKTSLIRESYSHWQSFRMRTKLPYPVRFCFITLPILDKTSFIDEAHSLLKNYQEL